MQPNDLNQPTNQPAQPAGSFFPQQQQPQAPQNGQPWNNDQAAQQPQQQPQEGAPLPPPDMQQVHRLADQLNAVKQQLSGVAENNEAAMLHQAYAQVMTESLQPSGDPYEQPAQTATPEPQVYAPTAPPAAPAPTAPPVDTSQPVSTGAEGELIIRPQQPQQQPPQQPNGNGNWNGDNNGNSN